WDPASFANCASISEIEKVPPRRSGPRWGGSEVLSRSPRSLERLAIPQITTIPPAVENLVSLSQGAPNRQLLIFGMASHGSTIELMQFPLRMQAVQTPVIPVVAELIRNSPGTISLGQGV